MMIGCGESIMKIAIINVVGVEGSTGKIATKLADLYSRKGHNCKIFHGRGKKHNNELYVKHGSFLDNVLHYILSQITGKEGYFSNLYTERIIKDIILFKPDRLITLNLHGHWLNIPLFFNEMSKLNIKIDMFMCDEYPYTGRCTYTYGCNKYWDRCIGCDIYRSVDIQYKDKELYYNKLKNNIRFTSVEYIVENAKKSSLLYDYSFNVKNTGIDTEYYYPVDRNYFIENYGITQDKIILINVAPFSNERKGVEYFLDAAKCLLDDKRFVFVNVGYDGKEKVNLENFIAIPYVSNQEELRQIYSAADMYVCTSINDALPNACVESMSCGTPIMAFNVSGMPYLSDYPVLRLVKEVSTIELVKEIKRIEKKDEKISEICRLEAINNYGFEDFADSLLNWE